MPRQKRRVVLNGHVLLAAESLYKGYGTDLAKTGRMLCWTSSTAGITFMPKNVVYDDNTSEPVMGIEQVFNEIIKELR